MLTADEWQRDPRPDLATDSDLWARLLALAYEQGVEVYGLFGALRGLRCMGAGLVMVNGRAKLVHGEMLRKEYEADRARYLVEHKAALVELLTQLDMAEEKAA